jgi:hypothetical protein
MNFNKNFILKSKPEIFATDKSARQSLTAVYAKLQSIVLEPV